MFVCMSCSHHMLFQELYDETRHPFKESKTVIDINHVIGSDLEIVLNSENKERLLLLYSVLYCTVLTSPLKLSKCNLMGQAHLIIDNT